MTSLKHIVGEEFFPAPARRYPIKEMPLELLGLLRAGELVPKAAKAGGHDFLAALKRIAQWSKQLEAQKANSPRGKPAVAKKRAEPDSSDVPVRSPARLAEVRYAITDFLLEKFSPKLFIPVKKKGRDLWLTTGWVEQELTRMWTSAVDQDNRDISDWNRQRVNSAEGSYTAVLAKDFYRLIQGRAKLVRMWLPGLSLAVLFTADGSNPNKPVSVTFKSRNRELKCFPLDVLWEALGIPRSVAITPRK